MSKVKLKADVMAIVAVGCTNATQLLAIRHPGQTTLKNHLGMGSDLETASKIIHFMEQSLML